MTNSMLNIELVQIHLSSSKIKSSTKKMIYFKPFQIYPKKLHYQKEATVKKI